MKLHVTTAKRVFIVEQTGKQPIRLPDPSNGRMSPEEVLDHYSGIYPILSLAQPELESMGATEIVYKCKTTIGSKG
ncbi:PRTRC system protein C [Chitinophaga pinensis]|uniref:PRTRC system protein C n=1 Tax=Chitinophaga pinensis (strain ATCC 43595 / DSM 2588 / LMG 13176 / NBRC 15968 / NCIMB 11800 / UQM 2034) TaxID=485918 RepID=A0A979G4S2_CHIPD|nr:PRTRC system protein C [Chitinophaga pinensis]ACU60698.1 hypothetical protein Cpin_3231 [Chitinophaga pinensis DSM 2588]